jgi:hypothetical protein
VTKRKIKRKRARLITAEEAELRYGSSARPTREAAEQKEPLPENRNLQPKKEKSDDRT